MSFVAKAYKSSLIQNTFFLFLNKGINAIVPIVLIPLCNNIFGVEQYGSLVYAQASLGLLIVFADYSFTVSAPRDISAVSNDLEKVSQIFSSIYSIKILLSILGFLILLVLPYFFSENSAYNFQLFLFVYLALLLQSFLPFWFFQGMKCNHLITFINFFSKILFLILVYFVAFDKKSILWIPVFEMSAYLLAFIISLVVLFKNFNLVFFIADFKQIIHQFQNGWNIFLIILLYWLINGGGILFVEKYSTNEELGYFSVFSRISYYLFAIFQPIIYAVVPYMTEKFVKSNYEAYHYFNRIFRYFLAGTIAITILLLLVSNQLFAQFFNINFNSQLPKYFNIFYVMVLWVFFLLINNFMAMQLLIASKKDKIFRWYLLSNALLVLICFFILIPIFNGLGAALAMLFGELLFFILIIIYYIKTDKQITYINTNKIYT